MIAAALPLLAISALNQRAFKEVKFAPQPKLPTVFVRQYMEKVPQTRLSPKEIDGNHLEFEWVTVGYGTLPDGRGAARFATYSQQANTSATNKALDVTRMLLRLWTYNYGKLKFDHSQVYELGLIDVFLCWGGKAGGEQLFDEDPQTKSKVNTIYLYDLNSFTDPLEMAREVAHEYGHATLPAVGGFKEPEDWANGYLGEKLYLWMLNRDAKAGTLTPEDMMGVTKEQLQKWVDTNVAPVVTTVVLHGPDSELLKGTSKASMDAYLGLAMYSAQVLGEGVFARAMKLIGSTQAKDFPEAIVLAAQEPEQINVNIPEQCRGQAIWLPLAKGDIFGGKILQKKGSWVKVQPGTGAVIIKPSLP